MEPDNRLNAAKAQPERAMPTMVIQRVPTLSSAAPMKGPPSMAMPAKIVRPEERAVRLHLNSSSSGPMKVLSE